MTEDDKALVERLRAKVKVGSSLLDGLPVNPDGDEAAERIEQLTAEVEELRQWAFKAYTVVEWVVGEGYVLADPHFDADDVLLDSYPLLGVETAAEARAALEAKP